MGGVSQMFHGMVGGRGLPDEATSSLRRKQPRALATQIAAAVACFFRIWVAKSWMATRFDSCAGAALSMHNEAHLLTLISKSHLIYSLFLEPSRLKEFLSTCHIAVDDHHTWLLLEHKKITHWSYFRRISPHCLCKLKFAKGPSQMLCDRMAVYIGMLQKKNTWLKPSCIWFKVEYYT
jgi:hypothetical protein